MSLNVVLAHYGVINLLSRRSQRKQGDIDPTECSTWKWTHRSAHWESSRGPSRRDGGMAATTTWVSSNKFLFTKLAPGTPFNKCLTFLSGYFVTSRVSGRGNIIGDSGPVCLCVCLSVCTFTAEALDLRPWYLAWRLTLTLARMGLKVRVVWFYIKFYIKVKIQQWNCVFCLVS